MGRELSMPKISSKSKTNKLYSGISISFWFSVVVAFQNICYCDWPFLQDTLCFFVTEQFFKISSSQVKLLARHLFVSSDLQMHA